MPQLAQVRKYTGRFLVFFWARAEKEPMRRQGPCRFGPVHVPRPTWPHAAPEPRSAVAVNGAIVQ
jgi:hypothetical protein